MKDGLHGTHTSGLHLAIARKVSYDKAIGCVLGVVIMLRSRYGESPTDARSEGSEGDWQSQY